MLTLTPASTPPFLSQLLSLSRDSYWQAASNLISNPRSIPWLKFSFAASSGLLVLMKWQSRDCVELSKTGRRRGWREWAHLRRSSTVISRWLLVYLNRVCVCMCVCDSKPCPGLGAEPRLSFVILNQPNMWSQPDSSHANSLRLSRKQWQSCITMYTRIMKAMKWIFLCVVLGNNILKYWTASHLFEGGFQKSQLNVVI